MKITIIILLQIHVNCYYFLTHYYHFLFKIFPIVVSWSFPPFQLQQHLYYYNNVIIQNMNRGKSNSRIQQLNQRYGIDKHKPSQSKNKLLVDATNSQTHNNKNGMAASPSLSKQIGETNKQNLDVLQSIIKIISAAAEAREKQILLSLGSQVQKQKKIRQYLQSHRQAGSDKQQLQAMIVHLRQQQIKEISSLKIEIGKRKLQNLDNQDLKQAILNLNSYVMRRTKKESLVQRSEGVDLLSQIYAKFDEQSKIISQLSDKNCKKSIIRQRTSEQISVAIPGEQCHNLARTLEGLSKQQKQKSGTSKSAGDNVSQNDLMHKILKLQKENLRLMKEVSKIEEQFQFVVEEKLMLEQKLDRVQSRYTEKKDKSKQLINKFNAFLTNKKDDLEYLRIQLAEVQNNFKLYFQQQVQKLKHCCHQRIQIQSHKVEKQIDDQSVIGSWNQKNSNKAESPELVKASMESQTSSFERYELILTEKQFEINELLRMLSNFKSQKQQMKRQRNNSNILYDKLSSRLNSSRDKLPALCQSIQYLKSSLMEISEQSMKQLCYIKQSIKTSLKQFQDQLQNNAELDNHKNAELMQKRFQSQMELKRQFQCRDQQAKKWQRMYNEYRQQNEKQKRRMLDEFTKIENILRSEKNQVVGNLQSSISQSLTTKKSLQEKQQELIELYKGQEDKESIILSLQDKIEDLKSEIGRLESSNMQLNQQINQMKLKLTNLDEQNEMKERRYEQQNKEYQKQRKSNEQRMQRLREQSEASRNLLIEQCGMLLESKIQEIDLLKIEIQRQRMRQEDQLSSLIQSMDANKSRPKNHKKHHKQLHQKIKLLLSQVRELQLKKTQTFLKCKQCFHFMKNSITQIKQLIINLGRQHQDEKRKKMTLLPSVYNLSFQYYQSTSQLTHFFTDIYHISQPYSTPKMNFLICQQVVLGEKLICLKNFIKDLKQTNLKRREVGKEAKVEKSWAEDEQQNVCELNDLEALSPEDEIRNRKVQNNSLGYELEPFKMENIPGDEEIKLDQIINQSGLVDEIESLRNELAESFKRNHLLERELKLYHQKDMDNIFDF